MNDNSTLNVSSPEQIALQEILRNACKKTAPVWSLENFVAVNPYLGHTHKKFEEVAQDLAAAAGIGMTLPARFYVNKVKEGKIKLADIATVLTNKGVTTNPSDFLAEIEKNPEALEQMTTVPTVADIASKASNKDWNRFIITRITAWAASFFDKGQATWSVADKNHGLFASWKAEASVDRTTELSGLVNFRKKVQSLPIHPIEAVEKALEILNVPKEGLDLYLQRVLIRNGGWAAYASQLDWDNVLYGGSDGIQIEFLAVLICWEACLLESLNNPLLKSRWNERKEIFSLSNVQKDLNQNLIKKLILQEAFDLAAQKELIEKFHANDLQPAETETQKRAQAIFCIDVRSEVFRRNLELVDDKIETLGFAGFFAFAIKYIPIAHENGEAQCPVLLRTGPVIKEQMRDNSDTERVANNRILNRQMSQVWKSFKTGAVTCFSFVSPMGLSFLPKLFTDSFGLTRPVPHPDNVGMDKRSTRNKTVSLVQENEDNTLSGISLEDQIVMGKNALNAMSLTENFGKFVMIVGHGSTMVNNPHATGYDCGACGGHTGESNARVAASVLNNKEVRLALKNHNIFIPENTCFLACLHDTTTDEISIYNEQDVSVEMREELTELKKSLNKGGQASRTERSLKMSNINKTNVDKSILMRSKDWSQVRPEWGLAGCSTFVVAPRERTKDVNLGGQSFLHSYNWKSDEGFPVLELIMTAPMVVTSWINLQYYGSTVDNKHLGSGNKTLHNVTAGVGVLEGYAGDLRVGLPLQAIHDGENFQHEPLRLKVVIEAPIDAMNAILDKHSNVKELCDNGWIQLMAMNDKGEISLQYKENLNWEQL
jgi:hypothetical protein